MSGCAPTHRGLFPKSCAHLATDPCRTMEPKLIASCVCCFPSIQLASIAIGIHILWGCTPARRYNTNITTTDHTATTTHLTGNKHQQQKLRFLRFLQVLKMLKIAKSNNYKKCPTCDDFNAGPVCSRFGSF